MQRETINEVSACQRETINVVQCDKSRLTVVKTDTFFRLKGQITSEDVLVLVRIKSEFEWMLVPKHSGETVTVMRLQMPVGAAYCITWDRSIGQTMNKVALDFRCLSYEHGIYYVIFSRARRHENILALADQAQFDAKGHLRVPNVVYPEILAVLAAHDRLLCNCNFDDYL